MGPDGQTNVTKLIVAVRNFANAPKNEKYIRSSIFGKLSGIEHLEGLDVDGRIILKRICHKE